MPYNFIPKDKTVAKAVRRIARERLAESAELVAAGRMPRPELVHELRKNVKKVRALLRLVRPALKGFAKENADLRDAGRIVSDLRDADVLALTFDKIADTVYLPPEVLADLRAKVMHPVASAGDPDAAIAAHLDLIARVSARARTWDIAGDGFDTLSQGLEKSWTAAQKAMRAAEAAPTGEALHLWRKRVKDHWYHTRLLREIWPEMMIHHMAAAETLGETLGDARDLAFLAEALDGVADAESLRAAALDEETRLLADARQLGRRFLSEPASGLSRRWQGWWEIWRA